MPSRNRTAILAHRGDQSRGPENTMGAFQLAFDAGAQGVETDVRASQDGVAMLIHDATLDRTTQAQGRVAAHSAAALQNIHAAPPSAPHEGIPTLEQLAAWVPADAQLVLDLKERGLGRPIRRALAATRFPVDQVQFCAWTPRQALEIRAEIPAAQLYFLARDREAPRDPQAYRKLVDSGFRGISWQWQTLSRAAIRAAHAQGLRVLTWTIDSPAQMRMALDAGVDGIITNIPARLRNVCSSARP